MTEPTVDSDIRLPDGRSIAYADFGPADGRPLVYFHGLPGSRLDLGHDDLLAPLTQAGFRLIGVDRPGFGRSDFVPGRTHTDWVDDWSQTAYELDLERFSILAYSRGGLFGLACAARIPERLDGVCLLSASASNEMPGLGRSLRRDLRALVWLNRRAPAVSTALRRLSNRGNRTEKGAIKSFARTLRSPADDEVLGAYPAHWWRFALEANRQGPAAFVEDFRRWFDWPLGFKLEDVSLPIALVHGEADNLIPISHSRFTAERLPRSQLEEIPGHGHLPAPEVLGRVAEALKSGPQS